MRHISSGIKWCHLTSSFYLIDSNDIDRLVNPEEDSRYDAVYSDSGLKLLLEEYELKDAHVLILANKQDLPNALKVDEIIKLIKFEEMISQPYLPKRECSLSAFEFFLKLFVFNGFCTPPPPPPSPPS